MDRAKDNDWNPHGYVHMDKLANLTNPFTTVWIVYLKTASVRKIKHDVSTFVNKIDKVINVQFYLSLQ